MPLLSVLRAGDGWRSIGSWLLFRDSVLGLFCLLGSTQSWGREGSKIERYSFFQRPPQWSAAPYLF